MDFNPKNLVIEIDEPDFVIYLDKVTGRRYAIKEWDLGIEEVTLISQINWENSDRDWIHPETKEVRKFNYVELMNLYESWYCGFNDNSYYHYAKMED